MPSILLSVAIVEHDTYRFSIAAIASLLTILCKRCLFNINFMDDLYYFS